MIDNKKVKIGDHCWAIFPKGELLVVLKVSDGYEVCGAWECGCGEKDLEIISIIRRPKKYRKTILAYGG